MKIIAVNISNNIKEFDPLEATERAWKLNIEKASSYDFVIGVSRGKVVNGDSKVDCAYFKLIKEKVIIDSIHSDRIMLVMKRCSDTEREEIKDFLKNKTPKDLRYFTTKYF